MPLKGIKVLEFAGLAPGPFCGKILADFGASVTRIDRTHGSLDVMQHGKRTLVVNLKIDEGQKVIRKLVSQHDVLIEPFRAGVMEKLNLGPELLCKENPRLIYARLTGFGQTGRLAKRAGHDINYTAISGVLSTLGRHPQPPENPLNLLADFAGGGLMCALGIILAIVERFRSGRGQVIDAAMIDGTAYLASWLFLSRSWPIWGKERGSNLLDGGNFYYDVYETKDKKYMSVGPIEAQFYEIFKEKLGLSNIPQHILDKKEQERVKSIVRKTFLQKTQKEWSEIFEDVDACVYPVLDLEEAMHHDHHKYRETFKTMDNKIVPKPAPRLNRTPGEVLPLKSPEDAIDELLAILKESNIHGTELQRLIDGGVIELPTQVKAKI